MAVSATEADVLRCGYNLGFFDKSDVITWADNQIAACDTPADVLLDLSMCRNTHPQDVMNHLRVLGAIDPVISLKAQIGFIGLAFHSKRMTLQLAIRSLFALAFENGISDDEQGMIYYLDDGYGLALAGTHGTLADTEREFVEFVTPYVEQLRFQYPQLMLGRKL